MNKSHDPVCYINLSFMSPFEHTRELLHLLKAFELKCFDGCNITRCVLWKYLLIIVLTSHLNVVIRSAALTTCTKSAKPSVDICDCWETVVNINIL